MVGGDLFLCILFDQSDDAHAGSIAAHLAHIAFLEMDRLAFLRGDDDIIIL